MDPTLTLVEAANEGFRRLLTEGLDAHNREEAGYTDRRPVEVHVRDPQTGRILGGVAGRTAFGLLFIDLVYLPKSLRGRDIGKRMVEMAEAEGRKRGCRAAVLYTLSFQAPGFYEKLGWSIAAELPSEPSGTSRIIMTKTLD
jgi:GNAT superfamily N-acetyltransferase